MPGGYRREAVITFPELLDGFQDVFTAADNILGERKELALQMYQDTITEREQGGGSAKQVAYLKLCLEVFDALIASGKFTADRLWA